MSKTVTIGAVALVIGMAGCITHAPGGLAYSTRDSENVGATTSGAGGVISGSDSTPTDNKQQRGNTPAGVDRDGHGPAAGAIVDPTGAATRGKAF